MANIESSEPDGVVRVIKEDGRILEGQNLQGKVHGFRRVIYADGRYATMTFKMGLFHGTRREYDRDGNLVKEEVYENDSKIQ